MNVQLYTEKQWPQKAHIVAFISNSKIVQVWKNLFIDLLGYTTRSIFSGILQMAGGLYIHRGCGSFNFWGLTFVMFVEGMNYKILGRQLCKLWDG